jgi:hypothetical protein
VLIFGQVSSAVATTLGLNMSLIGQMSAIGPGSVALVTWGAIQYVALDRRRPRANCTWHRAHAEPPA